MNECIIIRCINIGKRETSLSRMLSKYFNEKDIYFVCDDGVVESSQVLSLKHFLKTHSLKVDVPKLGWRCGDHCFYRAYDNNNTYDYYWLIEPDVYIDEIGLTNLTKESKLKKHDLLINNLRIAPASWYWYKTYKMHFPSDKIYMGFFPLVRLSAKAIEFAYEERKKLSSNHTLNVELYPNDEVFITSKLLNNSFSASTLECLEQGYFNLVSKYYKNVPKGVISHPTFYTYNEVIEKCLFDINKLIEKDREQVVSFISRCFNQNQGDSYLRQKLIEHTNVVIRKLNALENL